MNNLNKPKPKRKVLRKQIEQDCNDNWEHYGMPVLHFLLRQHFKYPEPWGWPEGIPGLERHRKGAPLQFPPLRLGVVRTLIHFACREFR